MANAERAERTIETVTTAVEPYIKLELSEAEARTLRVLTGKISGHTLDGPRKHTAAVALALDSVVCGYRGDHPEYPLASGSIRFSDYPEAAEPVRVPRVWKEGDTIPADVPAVRDEAFGDLAPEGEVWRRKTDGTWQGDDYHFNCSEDDMLYIYGPVAEVL